MARTNSLSLIDARRIVLATQGFGRRPSGAVSSKHIHQLFDRLHVVQVDSVNVLVRSQELPLWARLGPHPRDSLAQLTKRGALFEYWAHEASLLPVELQPLFRWRMAEARDVAWSGLRQVVKRQPDYVESVRAEVFARGSLAARELEPVSAQKKRSGSWWGWDDRKRALAYLFWAGEITAIRDPVRFERVYAPFEKVLPRAVLQTPTPDADDARRELLALSADALGVGTARDIADYFRIRMPVARPLIEQLAESGRIQRVAVEGWQEPAFLGAKSKAPKPVVAQALLSPFDSLVWERARTERLFDFFYRIEIYTPEPKRKYGYYVLPFLLGEAIVARVDLKADRAGSTLLVPAAYDEPEAPAHTAEALAGELKAMASWLGLSKVRVGRRGPLSARLRAALSSR